MMLNAETFARDCMNVAANSQTGIPKDHSPVAR